MAMNFLKDWIIQYQNKFSVGGVETTIDRITGTVSQEGDTIMASYLNEIQKNCIYQVNATRVIEGVLEIYDISIDGSDIFDVFDTQFIINFNETNTKLNPILRFNGNNYYIRFIENFIDVDVSIGNLQKTYIGFLDSTNNKLKLIKNERKLTFDTISDAQASTWLVEGDIIETLGYTTKGDGYGRKYIVETIDRGLNIPYVTGFWFNKFLDEYLEKDGYIGTANDLKNSIDSLWATVGTFVSNEQIMGVRFVDNGTDFVATRYGITAGAVQESTTVGNVTTVRCKVGTTFLDDMMIYRLMRRGIFDNNANLVFDQDAVGYDDTLSTGGLAPHTHWVGVYIPKFWYRYNVSYDATVPLTVVQHVVDVAISDKPFTGAKVHEWFTDVNTDGNVVERSYRVASAFEGVAVNGSTGAYLFPDRTDITTRIASDFQFGTPSGLTNYSTYKLTSVNKANAQAPAANATISDFRTMCQNRHVGNTSKRAITQQTWHANHAINILFMVYYASMNWQGVLSNGVTNLSGGSYNESVSTGYTSSMKNNSGFVSGIVRGTLGTTQVPNFKGIENFFGNVWKFNEGLKKLSTGLGNQVKIGTYNVTKTNNYLNYTNIDFTNEKEILNIPSSTNFFKFRDENMIALAINTSSNYYRDYFYSSVDGQIARSGASWYSGSISGGFAVSLNDVFGSVNPFVCSRVFS